MYSGGTLPKTGAGIVIGGVALSTMNLIWLAIAVVVLGGAIITASKFAPRVAIEPRAYGVSGRRWAFVVNGKVKRWLGKGK